MCNQCVKEPYLLREDGFLERSHYPLNFKGCFNCRYLGLKDHEYKKDETEDEESIKYDHICEECDHYIGSHTYTFKVDDERQYYSMDCILCGVCEYNTTILPLDPSKLGASCLN